MISESETSTITIAVNWIRSIPTPRIGMTWLISGGSWMPGGQGEMTFWKVTWRMTETAKLVSSMVAPSLPDWPERDRSSAAPHIP